MRDNQDKPFMGLAGRILRVDLTNGRIDKQGLDSATLRHFFLGTGYATSILWREIKADADALGQDNKLVLAAGMLTGTGCPGSDSLFACFKSPLTGCWGEARCGGGMGVELKRAGFDVLIIEGRASRPVYLWVHDGEAEIRSAETLWGLQVTPTQEQLKYALQQPKSRVICIGPAGEQKVRFANMMVEDLRALGRCGGGAVMGAKHLKAIVIRGTRRIPVADPDALKALVKEMTRLEREHAESGLSVAEGEDAAATFHSGTASFLPHYDACGETPTKNALSNSWGKGGQMYADLKTYITGSEGCKQCILRCGKRAQVKKGPWKTPLGLYPEYETMVSLGHYILNDDVEAIIHINHICNQNGLDTISCGNMLAFAMEAFEKGWITTDDTDGLQLAWGDMRIAKTLVEKICRRQGFGNLLAEGVKRAAYAIGEHAAEAAMHVKGLELPAHDIRTEEGGKAWAIQYGTANRGMCHVHPHEPVIVNACDHLVRKRFPDIDALKAPYAETGKGRIIKWAQDYGNLINALGLCNFHTYLVPGSDPQRYARVLAAVSGVHFDFEALMVIGERISNLQRCFNVREGFDRKDDYPPERLMRKAAFGPFSQRSESAIQNYDAMLDEYYRERGWNLKTGVPTRDTLDALALFDMVAEHMPSSARICPE